MHLLRNKTSIPVKTPDYIHSLQQECSQIIGELNTHTHGRAHTHIRIYIYIYIYIYISKHSQRKSCSGKTYRTATSLEASANSSRVIAFTFGLEPLGKE